MEILKDLNNKEKILLIGGSFSLLFIISYSINFCKLILGFINYTDTGIISLFFCYINLIIWYCYSILIEHELLQGCYYYGSWIAFILLIFYLSYEYYDDKFDTLLNLLIILIIHSTLYKIFIQIYDNEEKTLRCCSHSQLISYISILHWSYKAYKTKNPRNLNIFVALTLIFYSCSLIVYGEAYGNSYILFTNFGGIIVGMIYVAIWFYLNQAYPEIEEENGVPSLGIEVKNSDNKNKEKHFNDEVEEINQK